MMEDRNRHRFAREIKNCADRIAVADDADLPGYVYKLLSAILRMTEREGIAPPGTGTKNDIPVSDADIAAMTSRAKEYRAWYEALSRPLSAIEKWRNISGIVSDELSGVLDDTAVREIAEKSDAVEKALARLDEILTGCVAALERDRDETTRLIDPDSGRGGT